MRESGTVLGVVEVKLGSTLTADVTAGDTTVYVQDVAYFAPGGGTLTLTDGDTEEVGLSYTDIDEATGAISGLDGTANGFDSDDTLVLVSPDALVRYAEVRLDGQTDTVRARVPFSLFDRIADGFYSGASGEVLRVILELEDEYVVRDILGTVPDVAVDNLTVLDDLRVEGEFTLGNGGQGYVNAGSTIEFQGQQGAPAFAPTVTQDWESYSEFDPIDSATDGTNYSKFNSTVRRGAYWDTTDNVILYCGTGTLAVREVDPVTLTGTTVLSSVTDYYYGAVARLGSFYYVLCWHGPTGDMKIRKYTTSWVYDSQFTVADEGLPGVQGLSEDGTDLWVSDTRTTDGRVRLRRYSTAGVLQETLTGSSTLVLGIGDQHHGYSARAADYGSERHDLITETTLNRIRQLGSTGTYDSGLLVFNPATSWTAGLLWDGTNFWVLGNGSNISGVTKSTLYKLEGNYWDSSVSATKHLYTTWYDSDATGGTHETTVSPVKTFTARRRKRWTWAITEAIPDTGGSDDADSVRVYIGSGASAPANGAQWLQATAAAGETSGYVTDVVASGTNPPTTNDFPSSDTSALYSRVNGTGSTSAGGGVGWNLMGDGNTWGFSDYQKFVVGDAGTWTKPMVGGCSVADIILIGAGGGGGSGRRNSSGNAAGGGGGGGGGSIVRATIPLALLNSSETIVVGVGGAGGAGKTANADGNPGTAGTDSTMTIGGVAFLTAKGGDGGAGGTTAGGAAGSAETIGNSFDGHGGTPGGDGGTGSGGSNAPASPSVQGVYNRLGASGGGGGGGVTAGGSAGAGGNGGRAYDVAAAAGAATSTLPDDGGTKLAGLAIPGGGGGGSGGRPGTAATRAGGDGGLYGGGGGGSGGGQTVDSGDGGAGANGIVIVICR